MILALQNKHVIAERIAETLESENPLWLEKTLLLIGLYTSPRRALRSLKINGRRRVRKMKAAARR